MRMRKAHSRALSAIVSRHDEWTGRRVTEIQIRKIERVVGRIPGWLRHGLTHQRLAGSVMSLPNGEAGTIGFGEWMKWLSPQEIVDEASLEYGEGTIPNAGYIPIGRAYYAVGKNIVGTGDPICVKARSESDPRLISVSHETGPDRDGDLVICHRLSTLILSARISKWPPSAKAKAEA